MESRCISTRIAWLAAISLSWPALVLAQVPVDASGETTPVGSADSTEIPLLGPAELEELVGPIALYPDDLLAIVLPASTYPLQLVQADRFLQDLKNDNTLEPDESWDDSIVALLNYPEAIELLTDELDKTWRLGEAVVAQQADVVAAIEAFRDRAYAAGNLQSDTHQTVSQTDGVIEITPVEEDVIYVPYYEPERVVVYQSSPVYYYYPRAYPVYYYPYPYGYSFRNGFFWGVTTAFAVGWFTDSLHVYHHSYYGHPYYGRYYGYNYWYRNPSIHVHNNYYYNGHHGHHSGDRYGHGDYWRPHSSSTVGYHDQRVTRSRHYPGRRDNNNGGGHAGSHGTEQRRSNSSQGKVSPRPSSERDAPQQLASAKPDIKFRQRTSNTSNQSSAIKPNGKSGSEQASIRFRERKSNSPTQLASNRSAATSHRNRTASTSRKVESPRIERSSSSNRVTRSSQPQRVSPPAQVSRKAKRSSPSSSNSRTSRPASASKPRSAKPQNGGSNKVSGGSAGKRDRGSSRRR